MEKLLVVDGNSIVNRAFYGVRLLTNKEGIYTNAIYGFLNILYKYLDSENPDYICIAFDTNKPTFRLSEYTEYKAGRKRMPDELAVQIPVLKELLEAMNIPILALEGYEADDILGTIASMCKDKNVECIIATGDRDSLQLATNITKIYLTSTKGGAPITDVLDEEAVVSRYGVTPNKLIDVKGLMGDSSDNIPGVTGIGEKTALKLINEYGNLENLYEHIDEIKGSTKDKLINHKDMAFLSRQLATIKCDVPIEKNIDDFKKCDFKNEATFNMLTRLEFKSVLKRLEINAPEQTRQVNEQEVILIDDFGAANACLSNISVCSYFILSGNNEIASVCVYDGTKSYYFNFAGGMLTNLSVTDIKDFFENENIIKYAHNYKEDIVLLNRYGISLCGVVFDSEIAAYILEPSRSSYELGNLSGFSSLDDFLGKGKGRTNIFDADIEGLKTYASKCAKVIFDLKDEYTKKLQELGQTMLFEQVEMPLSRVLAEMEISGFKLDFLTLREFSSKLQESIKQLEGEIFNLAGVQFNINSPKQMGEILFEKLSLPIIRKTKTGYSTDSDVLDKLADKHPIIQYIKEYRTLIKLKSTYSDGLLNIMNNQTGKIHSKFNQTVTVTGRISSTEPNMQNIPIKLELGREIRKMFIASSDEYTLLDADYSQIELRILAHISHDENMIEAFKNNQDIHTITASQVFHVPALEVTPTMRCNAKAVNFGIVYGISDFALGIDLKISRKQARDYIDGYFEKYHGVKKYMKDIVEQAKNDGFVTTIMGRRRYIPELKSSRFIERSFGERVALNTPIQGSAADIIKLAMVNVYNRLKEKNLKSRLVLQVHDELIVETLMSEVDQVKEILQYEMENAIKLSVALVAEVKSGKSWYDAK